MTKEFLSEKYRTPIRNRHRVLEGNEKFDIPNEDFLFYLGKVFSVRSLVSILGVLIILFHENILEKVKLGICKQLKFKRD